MINESNSNNFVDIEFEILKKLSNPENEYIVMDFIDEIKAVVNKFNKNGQSGGSAPYTAFAISDTIKKLCLQQPIAPITGDDSEWNDVSEYDDSGSKWFQNKRCSAVFKSNTEKPYYLDAIVFQGIAEYDTFTGNCVKLKD